MTILLAENSETRHSSSYSGVNLPLHLVGPTAADALSHSNTFIRAFFDSMGALLGSDKLVYGEVELAHRYEYESNCAPKRACVQMQDVEPVWLDFEPTGELRT